MRFWKAEVVLVLFLHLCSLSARAEDTAGNENGECPSVDIVISYTRQETPREEVAADIEVVTREEIEKIPATTAAEVVQYVPGVYVEFNGGLGHQATASIQGSDSRHVAVYRDGVPLNMLANPMAELSRIPTASIERIEVYKGAASSSWGAALGGVINIITKEPDLTKPFTGEIQSSYGDLDTFRNSGTVSGTVDRFGYLLSLTHDETDGAVFHSDFREDTAYAKFNYYVGETGRLNFVYSYEEGRNENPAPILQGANFWEDLHLDRSYERLLYEDRFSENLTYTIEGRHREISAKSEYPGVGFINPNWDYEEELWGVSTRICHDTGSNHLVGGFDGDWGEYGYTVYSTVFPSGNWALYANDTLDIGAFSLIGGIRYDNNRDFGSEVSPLGGLVYRLPWKDALIRAQVAKGFSAPPGALIRDPLHGNMDLKAETGINYQLGGEIRPLKPLLCELNFFQTDVDDFIIFDDDLQIYVNMDVRRRGIEGRISTGFTSGALSGLAVSFGGSFIDVRDATTGDVVPDIPRVLYDVSTSHTYKQLTQSIVGRYVDNNSSFSETRDGVFLFDYLIKAKLPSPPHLCLVPSIFAAVHNFTNTRYLFRKEFPQPGRWIEGGVKLEF